MAKIKLTLSMEEDKIIELKKKALDAKTTLSQYLSTAGTLTSVQIIKDNVNKVDPRGAN